MKPTLLIIVIAVIQASTAFAGSMADGASAANAVIGKVNQSSPLSSDPKKAVPGFVTGSPTETSYSNGDISGAATQKALTEPAAQLINNSFATRPVITIDRNTSPIFQKAKTATDNPNAIITNLTGRYGECTAKSPVTTISSDIRTCDEYTETNDQTCQVGQVVTVDAKHNYQCNRSRVYNDYTCNRSLTLTCAVQGCDAGVFAQGSSSQADESVAQSDTNATWSYNYPTLKVGGSWHLSGNGLHFGVGRENLCYEGGETINFNISDITKVTKFLLIQAAYKSTISVSINGTNVYSDSEAMALLNRKCYINPSFTNNTKTLSINLLPYLHQGVNTFIITGVASYPDYNVSDPQPIIGSAELTIDTSQQCCASWTESWTDSCGVYK